MAAVIRLCLRAEIWCRLVAPGAFVHVGYDFYLYVGVSVACPRAIAAATGRGLFVEEFSSPYG